MGCANPIVRPRRPATPAQAADRRRELLGVVVGGVALAGQFFLDIDLVVCWDFDDEKMAAEGVETKFVAPEDRWFHGATHEFNWPGSFNLGAAAKKDVIVLRRLVEELSVA